MKDVRITRLGHVIEYCTERICNSVNIKIPAAFLSPSMSEYKVRGGDKEGGGREEGGREVK